MSKEMTVEHVQVAVDRLPIYHSMMSPQDYAFMNSCLQELLAIRRRESALSYADLLEEHDAFTKAVGAALDDDQWNDLAYEIHGRNAAKRSKQ